MVCGDILQNIGFQRHVKVDSAGNPAEFALAHIEDTVYGARGLVRDGVGGPGLLGEEGDGGFKRGETEEVDVRELLLVGFALEEVVGGGGGGGLDSFHRGGWGVVVAGMALE